MQLTAADPLPTTIEEKATVEDPSTTLPSPSNSPNPSNPPPETFDPSNPSPETLRSLGDGGPKPKTVYQLPATLSAIPVPKVIGTTSAKEATIDEREATASTKQLPTNYIIFAIIAVVGFVIGLVMIPKLLKK